MIKPLLFLFICFGLLAGTFSHAYSKTELRKKTQESIRQFYSELLPAEQQELQKIALRLTQSKASLNDVSAANPNPAAPVLLFIHGLVSGSAELLQPIYLLRKYDAPVFVFKWSKRATVAENVNLLEMAVKDLLSENAGRKIIVFAHSVGGVIAIKAFDNLMGSEQNLTNVFLYSIAAPVSGYNAPKIASSMVQPIIGATTLAVGSGFLAGRLNHRQVPQCEQWITTNCALDIHACSRGKVIPQQLQLQPCGAENVHVAPDQTHYSAIMYVINRVLGTPNQGLVLGASL